MLKKKNLYTTYRFMATERKNILNQQDQGSRRDIKVILRYARLYRNSQCIFFFFVRVNGKFFSEFQVCFLMCIT